MSRVGYPGALKQYENIFNACMVILRQHTLTRDVIL